MRDRLPPAFWGYPLAILATAAAVGVRWLLDPWLGDLLAAQKAGGDLPPHPSSRDAGKLPDPAYPTDQFPGHSAWIDGDWKLHRIENKQGRVNWELYNLAEDPKEANNLAEAEPGWVKDMQRPLEQWLKSVVESLNGKDYAGE